MNQMLKYVVGPLIAVVGSVLVARYQQEPHNNRGIVGYATLADRVNTLEQEVERQRQDIALVSKVCTAPPTPARMFKLSAIATEGLTPLRRVPSRFEHLSE